MRTRTARFTVALILAGVMSSAACATQQNSAQPPATPSEEIKVAAFGEPGTATSDDLSSAAHAITNALGDRRQFSAIELLKDTEKLRLYWHGEAPAGVLDEVVQDHPGVVIEVVSTTYSPKILRETARRLLATESAVRAAIPRADGSSIRVEVAADELDGTVEELETRLSRETGVPIEVGTAPPVPAD